ncbi:CAP domain-containing protein [Leptothrix ochracea]|uniref:CAP domain-containing protein n=1 Tax=Leptothrix ochracea TaxID=735331 RepID=UPI0034E242D1
MRFIAKCGHHNRWLLILIASVITGCANINQPTDQTNDDTNQTKIKPSSFENKKRDNPNNFSDQSSQLYDSLPDIDKCQAGTLKRSVKDGVLNTVNKIRSLHGLSPVSYDDQYDDQVMKGSLIVAASGHLTHEPQSSEKCYSPEGANGTKTSNIVGGKISPHLRFQSPDEAIIGWMTDVRNASGNNVGHRRWLLDPFLKKIAFGKVAGVMENGYSTDGAIIRVIWDDQHKNPSSRSENNFVAYPFKDYPQEYFDKNAILSFTAIEDPLNRYNNNADYAGVGLEVVDEAGNKVQVHDVNGDKAGYGVPNVLQFKIDAIQPKMKYMVNIRNVLINGQSKSYSYWFRIV